MILITGPPSVYEAGFYLDCLTLNVMDIKFSANILEAVFPRVDTQPQHYRASTTGSFSPPTLANAAIAASRVGAVVVLRVARHRTPNLKMRILNLI